MSKPLKPIWIYSAGGRWSRVYDADEVERELKAAATRPAEAMKLVAYRDWGSVQR
jgi:hypothetical protein